MNGEYRYPDGEELERLIAQVEEKEMLKAPVYLKQEILSHVKGNGTETETAPLKTLPVSPTDGKPQRTVRRTSQRKAAARMQLFVYSAKVVLAASAAMLCLFVLPLGMDQSGVMPDRSEREKRIEQDMNRYREQNAGDAGDERKQDITVFMNEKTDELCRKLNEFSNLFLMEERDYD